jgi:thioredoxin
MSSDSELERIKQEMLKRMMAPEAPKPSFWRDGQVMTLTDANFHTVLGQTDKPVLVDFWAEWCGPCKMMGPIVSQMAEEYAGKAHFAKLNTDPARVRTQPYGVQCLPLRTGHHRRPDLGDMEERRPVRLISKARFKVQSLLYRSHHLDAISRNRLRDKTGD